MTLPKKYRDVLGVEPGDAVDVVEEDGTVTIRRYFDKEKFDATVAKFRGTVDLGGMTVDEYIDDMRGH